MRKALVVSVLCLSAVGCTTEPGTPGTPGGSADGGACTTTGSGTLTVNVTGLPAGVDANVTITGPGGAQTAHASESVTPAASGDYTFTAATVTAPDPIVRKAYKAKVSVATAKVCDGQTASVDVTYTLIPTSNTLWWGSANSTNDTLGYASATLASTGSPAASVAASTPGTLPGAFDKDGNLWVIDTLAGSIGLERYPADTLAAGGAKTPDVIVTSDALSGGAPGPASIAFDPKGNLWVGVIYSQQVVEIDAASLAATGTVTPRVTVSNVPAPNAIAFDAKGNLWVGAGDNVVEYLVDHIAASTSAAPDTSIASQTPLPVVGPLANVLGLAFDGRDDLWVNYDGTIAEIPSTQLVSGTITPAIQIKTDVLSLPAGIAFDEGGGLWMAYSAGKFAKLGASQLTASGSVAPEVVVTSSSLGSATSPAFFPAPAAVPMYSALK